MVIVAAVTQNYRKLIDQIDANLSAARDDDAPASMIDGCMENVTDLGFVGDDDEYFREVWLMLVNELDAVGRTETGQLRR